MPRKQYDDLIIDVEIDESTRSSPALGQLDRLLRQSALETQSLQVVRRMMMRDMLDRAQVTGISKLQAAANLRKALPAVNGHERNGSAGRDPKSPSYGMKTKTKVQQAQTSITGPRLNLFILELCHKVEGYITGREIMDALKATGKADHLQRLSGVFGLLTGEGFLKYDGDKGYRILAAGSKFASKLRHQLETTDQCIPGEYLAPATYTASTRKPLGFKTMGDHMGDKRNRVHAKSN